MYGIRWATISIKEVKNKCQKVLPFLRISLSSNYIHLDRYLLVGQARPRRPGYLMGLAKTGFRNAALGLEWTSFAEINFCKDNS